MPDPDKYQVGYSFGGYQTTNPNRPLPGPALDAELFNIAQSGGETIDALKDLRRSDGKLQNGIVSRDALAVDVALGLSPPTLWATLTDYTTTSTVFYLGKYYRALVAHNSGLVFDPSKWMFLADLSAGIVSDSGVWFTGVDTIKTTSYAVVLGDAGKMLVGNSASPITFTFADTNVLGSGLFLARNIGTGVLTLAAAAGQSIEGIANPAGLALSRGWMAIVWVAGSSLRAQVFPSHLDRVVGLSSSVAGDVVSFAGTDGKTLADSGVKVSDLGKFSSLPENVQTSDYSIILGDIGKAVVANKASAILFTLPTLATAGTGVYLVRNIGAGDLTLAGAGSDKIEGQSTLLVRQGSAVFVWANGAVWKALRIPRVATTTEAQAGTATELTMDPATVAAAISALTVGASVPGAIGGLTLSVASTTSIAVAPGACRNEDGGTARSMALLASMTKTLSAWVTGTGNGGLDTGSIAASTWYYVHLIRKDSDGTIDVLLSLSATAPTMPSGYTARRRIGAIRTNASSQVTPFTQFGSDFYLGTTIRDIAAVHNTTSAVLYALTVPPLAGIIANGALVPQNTGTFVFGMLTSPFQPDEAPSEPNGPVSPGVNFIGGSASNAKPQPFSLRVNSSGQVRVRTSSASSATTIYIFTYGWTDYRGQV